jgi:hypothetical protein
VYPKISFGQNIILPKYCFAKMSFYQNKISFCQRSFCHSIILPNIILSKYCDAKYQSWVLPNISWPLFVRKIIGRKVCKITIWVIPNPQILHNL